MGKVVLRIFITLVVSISILIGIFILNSNSTFNIIKYSREKNYALAYLENKYSGFKFSIESIIKDPYDNTYISEVEARKQGQKPFVFQVRQHNRVIIDYFLRSQLGQDERTSLYETLGSRIGNTEIENIDVTRNSFASYGITDKNFNDKTIVNQIPIEVSVVLKGEGKIDNAGFVDLSIKIRDSILQKKYNIQEIRTHYNYSNRYMGLYLKITKEDFSSTKEQLEKSVSGHFLPRG